LILDTFATSPTITAVFRVPADARTGDLRQRLRVAVAPYAAPEACGDYPIGEMEDYRVIVRNALRPSKTEPTADREAIPLAYPNPASDVLFVNTAHLMGQNGCIRLINAEGKIMRSIDLQNITDEILRIDVAGLAPALYCLQIMPANGAVQTEKVMVNND
jgi:hypothetical protein